MMLKFFMKMQQGFIYLSNFKALHIYQIFLKFCPKRKQGYRLANLSNFALKCNKAIGLRLIKKNPKMQQGYI